MNPVSLFLELETAIERVIAITGKIDLVHCNDSKDEFGGGRDRHTNLGKGKIAPEAMRHMLATAKAPVICETPGLDRRCRGRPRLRARSARLN